MQQNQDWRELECELVVNRLLSIPLFTLRAAYEAQINHPKFYLTLQISNTAIAHRSKK